MVNPVQNGVASPLVWASDRARGGRLLYLFLNASFRCDRFRRGVSHRAQPLGEFAVEKPAGRPLLPPTSFR